MKKLFTLLLAAMLLCGAMAAAEQTVVFRDEHVNFDVTMVIPEGYTSEQAQSGRHVHIHLVPQDAAKAEFGVSVAYSELTDERTINEMSREEIDTILAMASLDFVAPAITETQTSAGTKIYLLDETDSGSDYMTAVTLYKGYFVTVDINKADFSALSEADAAMALEVLGGMQMTFR